MPFRRNFLRLLRTDYPSRTRQKDLVRWRCSDCTHGFMNPQPSWQELAPYYSIATTPTIPATVLSRMTSDPSNVLSGRENFGTSLYQPVSDCWMSAARWILSPRCNEARAQVEGVNQASTARRARKSGIKVFNGTLEQYAVTGIKHRSMSLPRIT